MSQHWALMNRVDSERIRKVNSGTESGVLQKPNWVDTGKPRYSIIGNPEMENLWFRETQFEHSHLQFKPTFSTVFEIFFDFLKLFQTRVLETFCSFAGFVLLSSSFSPPHLSRTLWFRGFGKPGVMDFSEALKKSCSLRERGPDVRAILSNTKVY